MALDIDGRSIPDGYSSRRPLLHAAGIPARGTGPFRNRVGLPDPFACVRLKRADAPDSCTTGIIENACLKTLPGRNRYVQPPLVERRGRRHSGGEIVLHASLPDFSAALRIDGVGARLEITEEHGGAGAS